MNETLEAICLTLFKHWFIDFEFPDENGKPYKSSGGKMVDSELGQIPEGWRIGSLGDYLRIKGRIGWKGLKKEEYLADGYAIINGNQIVDNSIDWSGAGRISKERYDESPEIMLQKDDILMTKDGTIGKIAYIHELNEQATVASGIFVIRRNFELISNMYVYQVFKSRLFKELINTRIEGSVVPHLYQRDLVNLIIPIPSSEVQNKFEKLVKPLELKIANNKKESLVTASLRDLLLPKLMSGKIRIPVSDNMSGSI
jgi:type I restriction enzyme S subunit